MNPFLDKGYFSKWLNNSIVRTRANLAHKALYADGGVSPENYNRYKDLYKFGRAGEGLYVQMPAGFTLSPGVERAMQNEQRHYIVAPGSEHNYEDGRGLIVPGDSIASERARVAMENAAKAEQLQGAKEIADLTSTKHYEYDTPIQSWDKMFESAGIGKLPFDTAKQLGLTDGSAESNLKLQRMIKNGEIDPTKLSLQVAEIQYNKKKAIRDNELINQYLNARNISDVNFNPENLNDPNSDDYKLAMRHELEKLGITKDSLNVKPIRLENADAIINDGGKTDGMQLWQVWKNVMGTNWSQARDFLNKSGISADITKRTGAKQGTEKYNKELLRMLAEGEITKNGKFNSKPDLSQYYGKTPWELAGMSKEDYMNTQNPGEKTTEYNKKNNDFFGKTITDYLKFNPAIAFADDVISNSIYNVTSKINEAVTGNKEGYSPNAGVQTENDVPQNIQDYLKYMLQQKLGTDFNENGYYDGKDYKKYSKDVNYYTGEKSNYTGGRRGLFARTMSPQRQIEHTLGAFRYEFDDAGNLHVKDTYDFNVGQGSDNQGLYSKLRNFAGNIASSSDMPNEQKKSFDINLGKPSEWGDLRNEEHTIGNTVNKVLDYIDPTGYIIRYLDEQENKKNE